MSSSGNDATPRDQLFLRKWNVTVANDTEALDLSQFHIVFSTTQSDMQTPNSARVRLYNLSRSTATKLLSNEYKRVVISAGYMNGPYGLIFDGGIKQTKIGKENQTDTYLDILAADGDEAFNFSVINQTLAAGWTLKDQVDALAKSMNVDVGYLSEGLAVNAGAARGKVLYGLSKDYLRQIVISNNARWSIQNGKLVIIANSDYIQANPIVLAPDTGLIGIPEQTQDGIAAQALLNPNLVIGQAVKIDASLINTAVLDTFAVLRNPTAVSGNDPLAFLIVPPISSTGLYRIAVREYQGDTRGDDWYVNLTCFAISPDVAPGASVNPFPGSN